jgi:hypothetical protein
MMFRVSKSARFFALLLGILAATTMLAAQTDYQVIPVNNSGTITGSVTWSGPVPHVPSFPINKDPEICDPDAQKVRDLERLVIGPKNGVANTVVFLKNISQGKAMDLPEPRRFLDQKHCRYEPHVLLVPEKAALQIKSSDATLHTVHMEGAATYNLPFPFTNQTVSRVMPRAGLADVRCNGGHTWMNAEIIVAPHPYYAVTDESGAFELRDVPPGEYEIVAWHEGITAGNCIRCSDPAQNSAALVSEPRTWQKKVSVSGEKTAVVDFVLAEK